MRAKAPRRWSSARDHALEGLHVALEVDLDLAFHLLELRRTGRLHLAQRDEGIAAGDGERLRLRLAALELEGARDESGAAQRRRRLTARERCALLHREAALLGHVL